MLNPVKDIKPISYVKAHTAEVLAEIADRRNPVIITQNGEAKAVLMNVLHYQNIIDSLNLLKIISIGENDIQNNRIVSQEELDDKIAEILN